MVYSIYVIYIRNNYSSRKKSRQIAKTSLKQVPNKVSESISYRIGEEVDKIIANAIVTKIKRKTTPKPIIRNIFISKDAITMEMFKDK